MAVKRYDGSQWVTVAGKGDQGTSSSISTWVKTVSGGETSLSGNDDNSQSLSYTVGQELVFINGTLLKRGSDYTATNGTSITGLTALAANDVATVWTVNAFSVTNAISSGLVTTTGDIIYASSANTPARLGIGSTGQVLKVSGGVPSWGTDLGNSLPAAKARQTVVQSISNNTWTKVTYTTEDYDTGSDFASSTFTCDTAGYYSINASVGFDSGTAIDYPRIRIYKNGANENETGINKQEYPLLTINTVIELAVNDTVEIYIYQDSGTSKNTGNGNRSMWFAVTGIRSL